MDLFEKTTDYYNEILTKCKFNSKLVTKLQEQQQKRITPKFNEDENKQLDRNIYNSIIEITKKIKNCEENIKQISEGKMFHHNSIVLHLITNAIVFIFLLIVLSMLS